MFWGKKFVASGVVFLNLSTSVFAAVSPLCDAYLPSDLSRPERASPTTVAGMFLYSYDANGQPMVLLGMRSGNQGLCTLGGLADPDDLFLSRTAAREVLEESCGTYAFSPTMLNKFPSHTFHSMENGRDEKLYRMYFAPVSYVPESTLERKLATATGCSKEYDFFQWTPLKQLLDPSKMQHPLFKLFEQMLQEEGVREKIEALLPYRNEPTCKKQKLLHTLHTYSSDDYVTPLEILTEKDGLLDPALLKQKEEETRSLNLVWKAATNLEIKMQVGIQRADACLKPSELKKHPQLRHDYLKAFRDKDQSVTENTDEPLTFGIMRYELGDQYQEVYAKGKLDERDLSVNIARTLLKGSYSPEIKNALEKIISETHEALPSWFERLLQTARAELHEYRENGWQAAYHGTTREIADLYRTISSLRELILGEPTSPYSGLRGTDLYFKDMLQDLNKPGWEKHIPIAKHSSENSIQYFCANVCLDLAYKFTETNTVGLFLHNQTVVGRVNFHSMLHQNMALLGMNCDPSAYQAFFDQQKGIDTSGALLQIFVRSQVLNEMLYPYGGNRTDIEPVTDMIQRARKGLSRNEEYRREEHRPREVRLTLHSS